MMMILQIGAGGAVGAVLRFLVVTRLAWVFGAFPFGTLAVNVIGSFVMGGVVGAMAGRGVPPFLTVGLLGGFTTFSAFSLDAVALMERGHIGQAGLYIGASVLFSILALVAGLAFGRMVAA